MTRNRNPRPLAGGAGEDSVDQAGKQVEPNYLSETPTGKVKYFGNPAECDRAAKYLTAAAFAEPDCKLLRLITCPDRPNDPLPNGVSAAEVCFDRSQFDDAVRWTAGCLTAGWIFFRRECRL